MEAGNAEKLSDAILELYDDFERKVKMGLDARNYVEEYACKEICVRQYIEDIERALKEHNFKE